MSDFLYEAIFIPEEMEKPPKAIIEQPELQVSIADFGKTDDWCLVAEIKEPVAERQKEMIGNKEEHENRCQWNREIYLREPLFKALPLSINYHE